MKFAREAAPQPRQFRDFFVRATGRKNASIIAQFGEVDWDALNA